MKTVYFLKGLPGSGKTTWAREKMASMQKGSITRVNKDDLRAMMHDGVYGKGNEKEVLSVRDNTLINALSAGRHVIIDDTNLNPEHERRIKWLIDKAQTNFGQIKFEVVDFTDVPADVCIERDAARSNPVGAKVIFDMAKRWLHAEPVVYPHDPALPDCVIIDLDGTYAHNTTGRSFYATDEALLDDELDYEIDTVRRALQLDGLDLVIFTGRNEQGREYTEKWLNQWGIAPEVFAMRGADDMRKDAEVKRDMFEEHIRGKYNVALVLDDRTQVVKMWRELGLKVWQVQEGNY